ncbi:hypothetical protein [Polynucleobacter sp. AM-26B4]|uniref:hypothetical protein n=1 Tax=Polynucleobacter sp. AM-26B4 TaxID=2689103 RepID=UPI001C0B6C8D|nr:hypothetical protein [Polynucleobacter sp. AM-26B4]MBU3586107.1 hypothetical protein [Polynucleobacter sp. AM-26B4]
MFAAFLIIIPFVTFVFYIRAISKTIKAIDPEYRTQSPGMAWLLLIPVFNVIWFFFLLKSIKTGFLRMYESQRVSQPIDTGYTYGIAMGCCWAAIFIPKLIFVALIPMFVFSILHWTKLNNARKRLSEELNRN